MDIKALTDLVGRIRQKEPDRRIIIFGSSSLLVSASSSLPSRLGIEITLDADLFLDPDDAAVRTSLETTFGEDHLYHQESGYYADFVDLRLSETFPTGWKERLVALSGFERVFALEPSDVAATKLIATAHSRLLRRLGRTTNDRGTKDIDTIIALVADNYVDLETVEQRIATIEMEPALIAEAAGVMRELRMRATPRS